MLFVIVDDGRNITKYSKDIQNFKKLQFIL